MKTIPSTEAKARFNALLAEVERSGEAITITSHGRPAALLSPVRPRARQFDQFPNLVVPDSFDDPMTEEELAAWEGAR